MAEGKKSSALARAGGKEVAEFGKYMDENYEDGISNEGLILPRVKIVQDQTKEKWESKSGDFLNNVSHVGYGNKIRFVPVFYYESRVYFDKLTMLCRSFDNKVGSYGKRRGQECETCKFKKWTEDNHPQCNLVYNYAIAMTKELAKAIESRVVLPPTILSITGAASKTAKYMNSNIRMNRGRKIPIWGNVVEMSTELREFPVGSAWIPKASVVGVVPKEFRDYLHKLMGVYRDMELNAASDDVGDDVVEPGPDKPGKPEPAEPKIDSEEEIPF